MKYNEIIHVNPNFIPVFDLENEKSQYWALFVPNNKFRQVLSAVIDSLNKGKNPVWLQGTYGTGKTHATSVVKHLLCDEELPKSFDLEDNQLTSKLNNFRDKNNVFPVVIKGTSKLRNSDYFSYTIQTAVEKALKDKGMQINIRSDFENMVQKLTTSDVLTSEDIKGTDLEAFGFDEIISRLENEESKILFEVENILGRKGWYLSNRKYIVDWLIDVKEELKNKYDIDYLMIFWDEFTNALSLPNADEILLDIQNIAEASRNNKGISLFIVSHRTRSNQPNTNQETIDKVLGRFERINYRMESLTTYQLMEKSIDKEKEWESVKDRYVGKISPLIEKISGNEGVIVKKSLENLYPIHPYTAYLATLIAMDIGSTERSIFKFLHEDIDYGFKHFIDTFNIDERFFLTPDYLWDFFYEDFEQNDDEKISSAIQKYLLYKDILNHKGEYYLVVFKLVLLLNILYKLAERTKESPVIPSQENIINAFVGSIYEDKVERVLTYIDEQGIINKTFDDIFELTTNALPTDQVRREKSKLEQGFKLTEMFDSRERTDLKEHIQTKILRASNLTLLDASIQEKMLISKLQKEEPGAYLDIYLFLCKNQQEFDSIKRVIQSISEKGIEYLKDKIMIISTAIFEEKTLNKYLDHMARARVASNHSYTEEMNRNLKSAKKYRERWVRDIKQKPVSYYLNNNDGMLYITEFTEKINISLSKEIYPSGMENLNELLKNRNIWSIQKSKAQAEKYLSCKSLDELNNSLTGVDAYSLGILKDNNKEYIVNTDLKLKEDVPENHPIKILKEKVDEIFKKAQSTGKFNLAEKLDVLTMPPFGLYPNKINIAALSFVLRDYVNRLYDVSKGTPINETKMRDKVYTLFEVWSGKNKSQELNMRFGSEDEQQLINLLVDVFSLEIDAEKQSIDNIRWTIKTEWINHKKIPLWLLKYSKYITNDLESAIDNLIELLTPTDSDIPDSIIQNCFVSLSRVNIDFKELLNEKSESLFEKLIFDIKKDIKPDDIPKIINYLYEPLPEEIYSWRESDVRETILMWVIENQKELKVKAIPEGGNYIGSLNVRLETENEGSTIYYKTSGNENYLQYKKPLYITENTSIQYYIKNKVGETSEIEEEQYVIEELNMSIKPESGSKFSSNDETIEIKSNGTGIKYKINNGNENTVNESNFRLTSSDLEEGENKITITVFSDNSSNITTLNYYKNTKIPEVIVQPKDTEHYKTISVKLTTENKGDIIYYKLDNSEEFKKYNGPIKISKTSEITYYGENKAGLKSKLETIKYIITKKSSNVLVKVKKTDANKLKDIVLLALEEHEEIQLIINEYLED